MCGTVGYVGNRERCAKALMEGLRSLQYRGYDSAGLAPQMACWTQGKPGHDDGAVPWPCSTE